MKRFITILLLVALVTTTLFLAGCGDGGTGGSAPTAAPASLRLISLTAPVGGAPGSVTLAWNAVANAAGYRVYLSTSNTVSPTSYTVAPQEVAGTTAPIVVDAVAPVPPPVPATTLVSGTLYYFVVTAFNSAGEGPASTLQSFIAP